MPEIIWGPLEQLDEVLSSLDDWSISMLALVKWEYDSRPFFGVSEILLQEFYCSDARCQFTCLQNLCQGHFSRRIEAAEIARLLSSIPDISIVLPMALNPIEDAKLAIANLWQCIPQYVVSLYNIQSVVKIHFSLSSSTIVLGCLV